MQDLHAKFVEGITFCFLDGDTVYFNKENIKEIALIYDDKLSVSYKEFVILRQIIGGQIRIKVPKLTIAEIHGKVRIDGYAVKWLNEQNADKTKEIIEKRFSGFCDIEYIDVEHYIDGEVEKTLVAYNETRQYAKGFGYEDFGKAWYITKCSFGEINKDGDLIIQFGVPTPNNFTKKQMDDGKYENTI
ncbi:MAG: hypothetical protein LBT30_05850 [Clostridiales bacterium]|nr:hypothetical protein [Clostridiales bacterium]